MVCATELILVVNSFMPLFKNIETVFREPSKSPRFPFILEGPRLFPFFEESYSSWEEFGKRPGENGLYVRTPHGQG
jgi:hypothetical protein